MDPSNLLAVIKEVKPRTALFTTFTLGLSYFEALLLPTLRALGCREIAILADEGQVDASLAESNARYAGRRYVVLPVRAPGGGIFHPKLGYFQGDGVDVLTVSSGNLTAAGQVTQLETFDAVSSDVEPLAFDDFATFARSLAEEIAEHSPAAASVLRHFAERAKPSARAMAANRSDRTARLVHSLGSTGASKLVAMSSSLGVAPATVTVLSPYHAPDARPVFELAQSLGATNLRIGLHPESKTAPFDEGRLRASKRNFEWVVPAVEHHGVLHAKAFEILGPNGALVVTGSFNATHQSLYTTKNVEVSLARWLNTSCFEWTTATPQKYEPCEFLQQSEQGSSLLLECTLGGGSVTGRVLAPAIPSGMCSCDLLRNGLPLTETSIGVRLADNLSFTFRAPDGLPTEGSLQLRLKTAEMEGRCWVTMQDELTLSDDARRSGEAVNRILANRYTPEDVGEVLHLFSRLAQGSNEGTPAAGSKREPARPPSDVTTPDLSPFDYWRWHDSRRTSGWSASMGSGRHAQALRAFMHWLHAETPKPTEPPGGPDTPPSSNPSPARRFQSNVSDQDDSRSKYEERLETQRRKLANLVEVIPDAVLKAPKAPESALLLRLLAAYAVKRLYDGRFDDEKELHAGLSWLDTFRQMPRFSDEEQDVPALALAMAALVAQRARALGIAVPASSLKESAVRCPQTAIGLAHVVEGVRAALGQEVFRRVPTIAAEAATAALEEVFAAPSLNERILALATAAGGSARATTADEMQFPGLLASMSAFKRSTSRRKMQPILKDLERQKYCPHCYRALSEEQLQQLREHRALVCGEAQCKRPVLYIEDAGLAQQVSKALNLHA